ncbi:MAG: APC family permease [Phycisphaerae bacterium]
MDSPQSLPRRVGAFTAACVIVSNMIGVGIFGTTGFMARDLGQPGVILLLWAAGGVFSLMGAMCYSELGAALPRAGGEYVYIREAFGALPGFLSGWMSLTIGFSAAIASNAHLFANHLQQLFPATGIDQAGWQRMLLDERVAGLVMVWLLTVVHVAGVGVGGLMQRLLTALKVGAIGVLIVAGLVMSKDPGQPVPSPSAPPSWTASTVLVSFLFVTFAYSGWNAAGYLAGEMSQPQRSVPRATIWATVCVTVLYLGLNVVYLHVLPMAELAADPIEPVAHKAAAAIFGIRAGRWMTIMLCVSIVGAASAMIWAGPRVYYAMARDGVFPAFFGKTTQTGQVPGRSIILQSVLVSVLVISGRFEQLLLYAGFALMVFTALAVASVLVLRVRQPQCERPYRVKPYPWVPVLYLLIAAGVMWATLRLRPTESLLGLATVAVGVPFYFLWSSSRRSAGGR